MKRASIIVCLCLVYMAPAFGNSIEQDLNLGIDQVTVYLRGAQITRGGDILLKPGRNELVFSGLTRTLQPQTIQLSGKGDYLILSLTHRYNYLNEHPKKKQLEELISKRDAIKNRIEQQQVTKSILERELNILMANSTLKGSQQNLSATEIKQAMEYFKQQLTSIESQKLEIKNDLASLNEQLKKINQQINELNSSSTQTTSEIAAVVESDREQRVNFSLSYQVNNAGWYPSYDVRVSDISNPLNLSYKANIHQSTGVDWDDVSLTVTSAIPEQGANLPNLNPWYLRFFDPQSGYRMEESVQMLQDPASKKSSADELEQKNENRGRELPVQMIQNQTSFSYQINTPYKVQSGGKHLTVEIKRHQVPASYRYYAVPKMQHKAYLTARVSDWHDLNLLPGNSNLFFEKTYVGKSNINPQVIGDTLTFSLGSDKSVVIERNKLKEFREKNFFGNKIQETFAWEIAVRNSKDKAVEIQLEDQIPVSTDENISVSLNSRSGARYDRTTGKLYWTLTVEPGETRKVSFEYLVEYPRGRTVQL
ncbi:MAG: mucoidy inhibitor MuiA family protein [Balneolaceae bacterium]|nr:mucoidy inhibitor MuiA family protein [Balneolaceae bacterium]